MRNLAFLSMPYALIKTHAAELSDICIFHALFAFASPTRIIFINGHFIFNPCPVICPGSFYFECNAQTHILSTFKMSSRSFNPVQVQTVSRFVVHTFSCQDERHW